MPPIGERSARVVLPHQFQQRSAVPDEVLGMVGEVSELCVGGVNAQQIVDRRGSEICVLRRFG